MDLKEKKKYLIARFVSFLKDEVEQGDMDDDTKESLGVAMQCLETSYDIQSDTKDMVEKDKIDLLSLVPSTIKAEERAEAEAFKNKGNACMEKCDYSAAVDEYTKAIGVHSRNAVYYCNRAAAYIKLEKYLLAVDDCKEAIKLNPVYGKAFGRLGTAYYNLNRYEDSRNAFLEALMNDPGNETYMANYNLVNKKLAPSAASTSQLERRTSNVSDLTNVPSVANLSSQLANNTTFGPMLVRIVQAGMSSDPNLDALMTAREALSIGIQTAGPSRAENLSLSLDEQNLDDANDSDEENPSNNSRMDSP